MDKPDPAVLQALFGQPPAEAIAFLESKGLRVTFNWAEMLDEAHARAFTVAKATQLDVLQDIRRGVLDALKQGQTLRQFEQALTPLLQQKGWWGKQTVTGPDGEDQEVQLGSPRRLKTIYQTNLQSAYMAGRMKAQMEADAFPYLMYVAVMDSRTRPSHAALNGKVWRKDDPVWASIYPPNGFNCRCRTRALTAGQLAREGRVESPAPDVQTREVDAGNDSLTGEIFRTTQTGVTVPDARGRPVTMWVDPGFNTSPLAGHPMDELLTQKAIDALGDPAAFDLVRQAVLSATRLKAWQAFVDSSLDSGIAGKQGQTMTVGMMPLELVRTLGADGVVASPVLYLEDRLIAGKKATRHQDAGDAASRDQVLQLPQSLPEATWYMDIPNGNLLAIMDGGVDTVVKATFSTSGEAYSLFTMPAEVVKAAVKGKQWKLLVGGRGT